MPMNLERAKIEKLVEISSHLNQVGDLGTTLQELADAAAELGRQRQLALEDELVQFFKDKGMDVYEPDVKAFRDQVQKAYLESDFAKDWVPGMIDKINALGE